LAIRNGDAAITRFARMARGEVAGQVDDQITDMTTSVNFQLLPRPPLSERNAIRLAIAANRTVLSWNAEHFSKALAWRAGS
jgi:hypothetical protein